MSLCRLIYKSIATAEIVSNETLRNLEDKSTESNSGKEISGLLVLAGNVFLQVLEGSPADVTSLFRSISLDQRHRQLELVSFELTASRLFDEWGMRLVDLYDLPGEKRALLATKYANSEGEIVVPSDPVLVCAFLLDAKYFCSSTPWKKPVSPSPQENQAS